MTPRLVRLAPVVLALAALANVDADDRAPLPVSAVDSVGVTVSNLDRALDFYTSVLPFERLSDAELSGSAFERMTGLFGARARVARLRLGDEVFELTEYLTPGGRPVPPDLRANDRLFQHVALIVSDIDAAYARLRAAGVRHASTGPQRLPDWNTNAGGIKAFYFRDPDGHFLELLQFPAGKGPAKWHRPDPPLFLGIDHTAIVVDDSNVSLELYRDVLGLEVAGESENSDVEQEHLNNVFGVRLRITTLRARSGAGIELLEYLAPRDGKPAPLDIRANDLAHWETTLRIGRLEPLLPLARAHRLALVSSGPIDLLGLRLPGGFTSAALVRDADGHALRLVR